MQRSLSVLLPVRNVQSTLTARVQKFLEVSPELTPDFELLIVDDGSTDATIEVADELARCYPQVRAVRHAAPRGRVAAIHTGLVRSAGDVILLNDDESEMPVDEIHRLWRAMDRHEIVLGSIGPPPGPKRAGAAGPEAAGRAGFQMMSRRAIEPIVGLLADPTTLLAAVSEQGYSWCEVELRGHPQQHPPHLPSRSRKRPSPSPAQTDSSSVKTSGPKRPNYLTRLRNFALGE